MRGLLYAGTETGVFVSFDSGAHWQSLQLNLPRSPVHDLVVKDDDLVIATHGRSFWILDDITPLRQVQAAAASNVHLYKPEVGYRLYYPDQVDARPPAGENPPPGVLIDYYLRSVPSGPLTINIVDSNGTTVRHLTSVETQKGEQPPEWPDEVHPATTLPVNTGMNRFVWNLRFDDPAQIPGAFYAGLAPRGPLVLPGEYTLELECSGEKHTVRLTIRADPRVRQSPAGLEQKFALSMQVYHDQDALHRAVNDIRRFKGVVETLKQRGSTDHSAALTSEASSLVQKASEIEGILMQVNIKGSEANLNYPGMLNEQIYSFASLLDDADTAPNAAEIEVYKDFHSKLAAQLSAWSTLKATKVAAFCARYRAVRQNEPPVNDCP